MTNQDVDRALRRRADEHLRPAEAGADPRRGRPRLGRRRQGVRRPARRHRRQRARPRATRRWSLRSPSSSRRSATSRTSSPASRRSRLAERLLALLGPTPRRRRGVLRQLRRRGQRGRVQAHPAHRPHPRGRGRGRLPRPHHGRARADLARRPTATPFEPLPGDVTFVPYGDVEALAAAVTDRTAAVLLEPIQGEAGVVVPPEGYLAAARRDRHRRTAPCSGSTRCRPASAAPARWFAHRDGRRRPPTSSRVAKGLGGGFPIGACLGARRRRRRCSSPATTAPPSAATRSPARRRSR